MPTRALRRVGGAGGDLDAGCIGSSFLLLFQLRVQVKLLTVLCCLVLRYVVSWIRRIRFTSVSRFVSL